MEPSFFVSLGQAQAAPSPGPTDISWFDLITHSGPIGFGTLLLLAAFSIVSWAIIFSKWRSLRRAQSQSVSFLETFWQSKRLDAIFQVADKLPMSPLAQIFRSGYIELAKLKKQQESGTGEKSMSELGGLENIERSMRRASLAELTQLEALVPFLATTGSTAPFIGLFGTVWGIMKAFRDIGRMGSANLATVAPGISEALVATAAGLLAAIPAVMAYNYFTAKIRVLGSEMENFQADFLNIVKRHFF
ncbi:MAG: protein TolQ [Deltaproteobacteria bacterium]|nr:protein TolQ [Deltaproteobacteria bacterium]